MSNEKTVPIKKSELQELKNRSRWLSCLEAAGVDNWEGIQYAHEMMQEQDAVAGEDD
jgi:hypothetical protein